MHFKTLITYIFDDDASDIMTDEVYEALLCIEVSHVRLNIPLT
jgi:hypothetical protein